MEIRNLKTIALLNLALVLLASCGRNPILPVVPEALPSTALDHLTVVATDYKSGGQLVRVNLAETDPTKRIDPLMPIISTDPVLRVSRDSSYLFVLNRAKENRNVQLFNKETLAPLVKQFSFENTEREFNLELNLQDVLVTSFGTYLSSLNKSKLLKIDPLAAKVIGRVALPAYVNEDGSPHVDSDGLPEQAHLSLIGGKVWLALQRMDRGPERKNTVWVTSAYSSVVVIDPRTDSVEKEIKLKGLNPVSPFVALNDGTVLVANRGGNESNTGGGIERVEVATRQTCGLLWNEEALGGKPSWIVSDGRRVWALVSTPDYSSRLLEADLVTGAVKAPLFSSDPTSELKGLSYDPGRQLLFFGERGNRPLIHVWDVATGKERFNFSVGLPPEQLELTE